MNNHIVLVEKGRLKSKLPFLKVADFFDFIGVEFYATNGELICANYVDIPDENGISKILGFGMIGDNIGKGLGGQYFIESLYKMSKVQKINGVKIWKPSCNKFSEVMLQTLMNKISEEESIKNLSFSDSEYEIIIKTKTNNVNSVEHQQETQGFNRNATQ